MSATQYLEIKPQPLYFLTLSSCLVDHLHPYYAVISE
jgi:hypothetical protein